jgi:site-specific recombinase XerD
MRVYSTVITYENAYSQQISMLQRHPPISSPLPVASALPPDRHPVHVYIARLGSGSRRTMTEALNTIAALLTSGHSNAEILPWPALRYQHTGAIRAALIEKYKPSMANKVLAALRGVLKECWRLGYMTAEDYHRAADVPTVRAQTLPRGRALASGEIAALMSVCGRDDSPAGARDSALIAMLYAAGLRRSEAVSLDAADYNSATGELAIRSAKGRKDRLVYATNGLADALTVWINVRGSDNGPLFCNVNKSGRITVRRLSDQAVLHVLHKRAIEAGVASFSPHDLRRSFIGDLLDAGADISTVQQLAGHSNVQTTARYDRRGETTKRKAAELLHVPYFRPRASR